MLSKEDALILDGNLLTKFSLITFVSTQEGEARDEAQIARVESCSLKDNSTTRLSQSDLCAWTKAEASDFAP